MSVPEPEIDGLSRTRALADVTDEAGIATAGARKFWVRPAGPAAYSSTKLYPLPGSSGSIRPVAGRYAKFREVLAVVFVATAKGRIPPIEPPGSPTTMTLLGAIARTSRVAFGSRTNPANRSVADPEAFATPKLDAVECPKRLVAADECDLSAAERGGGGDAGLRRVTTAAVSVSRSSPCGPTSKLEYRVVPDAPAKVTVNWWSELKPILAGPRRRTRPGERQERCFRWSGASRSPGRLGR